MNDITKYFTLLTVLLIKIDRNEIEHDFINNFLQHHSGDNTSFNVYVAGEFRS
jgi:hypothetical protein